MTFFFLHRSECIAGLKIKIWNRNDHICRTFMNLWLRAPDQQIYIMCFWCPLPKPNLNLSRANFISASPKSLYDNNWALVLFPYIYTGFTTPSKKVFTKKKIFNSFDDQTFLNSHINASKIEKKNIKYISKNSAWIPELFSNSGIPQGTNFGLRDFSISLIT